MQEIISSVETIQYIKNKVDNIQNLFIVYLTNPFFPWVVLILLLSSKQWKRPIVLILVGHWFLRSTGDFLRNTMELRYNDYELNWPFSTTNWYISNALAHICWLSGEILGDWYPLLRTKAVTGHSRKMKFVYGTCLLHNAVKIFGMYTFFMHNPIDLRKHDEQNHLVRGIVQFNIAWWSTVTVMQLTSFLYDLSVILALKTCLFSKLNHYKNFSENTFLDKFKQISEFRIIFSMIFSLIFFPFVVAFVIFLVTEYNKKDTQEYATSDSGIEQLRQVVLNFNYTLMYVDQILLRYYSNKNRNITANSNANINITTKSFNSSSKANWPNTPYSSTATTVNSTVYLNKTLSSMTMSPSSLSIPMMSPTSPMSSSSSTSPKTSVYPGDDSHLRSSSRRSSHGKGLSWSKPSNSYGKYEYYQENDIFSNELSIINEYPTLDSNSNSIMNLIPKKEDSPLIKQKSNVSNIKSMDSYSLSMYSPTKNATSYKYLENLM